MKKNKYLFTPSQIVKFVAESHNLSANDLYGNDMSSTTKLCRKCAVHIIITMIPRANLKGIARLFKDMNKKKVKSIIVKAKNIIDNPKHYPSMSGEIKILINKFNSNFNQNTQ